MDSDGSATIFLLQHEIAALKANYQTLLEGIEDEVRRHNLTKADLRAIAIPAKVSLDYSVSVMERMRARDDLERALAIPGVVKAMEASDG